MRTITVTTPSFNQGKFIEDTIKSVLAQKGDFLIDYIIMDGGSEDESIKIIKKYNSLLKRECKIKIYKGLDYYCPKGKTESSISCNGISFRWESRKDRGQVHALKKGFRMASGDIYCWLNSDDIYIDKDVLQKVVDHFDNDTYLELITGDGHFISKEGEYLGLHHVDKINYKELLFLDYHILQPSSFIRKNVYKEDLLDERFICAFDAYFFIRLISEGIRYKKVNDHLGAFRFYEDNKTLSLNRTRYEEQKKITKIFSNNIFYNLISYIYRYFSIALGRGQNMKPVFQNIFFKILYRFSYKIITGKPGR